MILCFLVMNSKRCILVRLTPDDFTQLETSCLKKPFAKREKFEEVDRPG